MRKQIVITYIKEETKQLEAFLDRGYTVAHIATTAIGQMHVQSTVVVLNVPEKRGN